jgi:hypothetical protein
VTAIVDAPFRSAGKTPAHLNVRALVRSACISLAAALSAAVMLTGCATTKAATVIEAPRLAVPQAPERVLVPAEQEPLAATPVGPDTPVASVPRVQQPPPSAARPRTARSEGDVRSDAAQPASSTVVQNPGGTPEATRQLRVVPSSSETAVDQQNVQNLINKVDADLKKVDPSKLSSNDAANFRDSKRFLEQAGENLKKRNVDFALVAAQKAADLAATLPNR